MRSLRQFSLIIVHYHFRPGGIRRVIELAVPYVMEAWPGGASKVVLACGEPPDKTWLRQIRRKIRPVLVKVIHEPAFRYVSEQHRVTPKLRQHVRAAVNSALDAGRAPQCVVWAHNLGIARNLFLSEALADICSARETPLISHHHDWWFDNRWLRWPEMRRCGFSSLNAAARAVFPAATHLHHAAINRVDAQLIKKHFPAQTGWLPNLTEAPERQAARRLKRARSWLQERINDERAPVWVLPCRLLRRKNIAEALLLTRWLRPHAWLVTTGGASSVDEMPYARALEEAANRHGWRLQLGVLQKAGPAGPSVGELLGASEAILLTSIQEGFGLPFLEAAAAGRPLLARSLPNVAPDLKQFGFKFPQSYDEIWIDPRLFDFEAEKQRQQKLFAAWKRNLPAGCRSWAGRPVVLANRSSKEPVPFSRLTLTAQFEVLAEPQERSWELCEPMNPFLKTWQRRAQQGRLEVTPWPSRAEQWLSGPAYARRFLGFVQSALVKHHPSANHSQDAQEDFMRERLGLEHLFPLLWARQS